MSEHNIIINLNNLIKFVNWSVIKLANTLNGINCDNLAHL